MQSTVIGLIGAFFLFVATAATAAGLVLLNQELGLFPTSVFYHGLEIGTNGQPVPVSNNTACALLLGFSALLAIAGLSMLVCSFRRATAPDGNRESE